MRTKAPSTIRFQLTCLVLAAVLPVWLVSGFLVFDAYSDKRDQINSAMLDTARSLTMVVDQELKSVQAALLALATSPAFANGDFAGIHRQALELLKSYPGADIIVADVTGQQLVNSFRPYGDPLPKRKNPETVRRIFVTGKPVISDLYYGAVTKRPMIGIDVPVFRDGKVAFDLAMTFPSDRMLSVLQQKSLPPDWYASILDSKQIIVARSRFSNRYVGKGVTPGFRQAMALAPEGTTVVAGLEGNQVFASFCRSAMSGWSVALGIPKASVMAEIYLWVGWAVAGSSILSLFGIAVALGIGRRIVRTEEALKQSEERHQLATTVAKEAIWEVDFGTGATWWNRAYNEIFSRPSDEHHHGKWWLHQIHPDDRERVNDSFSRAVNEGTDDWADTYRMKRVDGRYAFIRDRAIIVRDAAGNPLRAVGAKLDVTEQVEAEEALRESEDRLHFALETCQTGAWDLNLADHNVFRSFEHDRIFGYMELLPEWTYEIFLEHVLPEDRTMVEDKFQRALEKQEDLSLECRIRRTDGQVRWIWAAGRHRQFAVEAQRRMVGIVQDITERKQAEDEILKLNANLEKRVAERTTALANTNEQLKLEIAERQQIANALKVANDEWANTFNASTDPIMILDSNCRIRRANSSMAALLGKQVEECVGKFCYEQLHHTEAPILLCPHNQMLHDGRPHTAEIFEENIGKHMLVTVSPLFDAKGKLTGSMHYAKDITLLKEAEQVLADVNISLEHKVSERTSELVQATEEIKKVSFELVWAEEKERERIASELHDQVGQSLLLAKMKLDALAEKLSDDSLHTDAAAASSLVETAIHDIRSLTFRMRPPILDTAGIETALKWLCSSISYDYKINVEFADDDKPKQLSIELRYSLYQAVRELLLNVVKHADTEKASLSICTDNHTLVVHVTDKGVGFNSPDAIIKHVNKGGYGLYNVKQRVERMGGRFEVESAPGRGTSVTLSVPLDER